MFNIDNFYYTLTELLSQRVKNSISTMYFSDPGSTNIQDLESLNKTPQNGYPVILFYDQEYTRYIPDFIDNIYHKKGIPSIKGENYLQPKTILANSEKNSIVKNKLLDHVKMFDFYYFYHGFAALDWYRSHRFLNFQKNYTHDFLINSNGIGPPRSYRLYLLASLAEKNLLQNNIFSFSAKQNDIHWSTIVDDEILFNSKKKRFIKDNLKKFQYDVYYDSFKNGPGSAELNNNIYSSIRYQIVTETLCYDNRLHLTEKVFQPIVTKTPFILAGGAGNLDYLCEYGFKNYNNWLPYDSNNVHWKNRLDSISQVAKEFSLKSIKNKDKISRQMQKIAEFNYNHFYGNFFNIIYKELLDNFDQAWQEVSH